MLEIWATSSELSTTSSQNPETIGNPQFLEKQMEFVPIQILLIVFLFFYIYKLVSGTISVNLLNLFSG